MKTVGEFKKAGLVFVVNDMPDGIMKVGSIGAASLNANDCFDGMGVVGEFAWRENTGVKPEFGGLVEWVGDSGAVYVNRPDELIWSDKCIAKWRPSLNQSSVAESDTKQSAEEKRMDIIGQNGNDGLHYDNTAQQVEALAANHTLLQPRNPEPIFRTNEDTQKSLNEHLAKLAESKPIFTQAMADAEMRDKEMLELISENDKLKSIIRILIGD